MAHNSAHAFARVIQRTALAPLSGVSEGLLKGALRDRDTLHADIKSRAVHHRKHARKPFVFFPNEKSRCAATIAIDHGAGRRGMDSELVLNGRAKNIVARAKATIGIDQNSWHQEERDAARA